MKTFTIIYWKPNWDKETEKFQSKSLDDVISYAKERAYSTEKITGFDIYREIDLKLRLLFEYKK